MAVILVASGGDLQAALDSAAGGDVIKLEAGATFLGDFTVPTKSSLVTLTTDTTLPAGRIDDGATTLAIIGSDVNDTSALDFTGAANWLVDGIEFLRNPLGGGNVITCQGSSNITFKRIRLMVPDGQSQKRGIAGNGTNITLTESRITGINKAGQDSQAFCAWDGAGPYTVTDNTLEAASENIMFGGANSSSAGNIPADILVENNWCYKRLAWYGTPLNVKNLFELKSAKRVSVKNNLFENNWTDGQNGYGVLLTVRNDEGGAPWSVVEDVTFEHNILRGTEGGINILGYDQYQKSGRCTRLTIQNNLIIASGKAFQVGGEVGVLTIDHNTVDQAGTLLALYSGTVWVSPDAATRPATFAVEDLTFTNNFVRHGSYGVLADGGAAGATALNAFALAWDWDANVLGGVGNNYPIAGTTLISNAQWDAEIDEATYLLETGSPYEDAGTDGEDIGWNGSDGPSPEPDEPDEPDVPGLTYQWTVVSAPDGGTVVFSAPNALCTTATFSIAGVYVLRLTASDCSLSGSDDLTVTVLEQEPEPVPPVSRTMRRLRRAPHLSQEGVRLTFDKFQLDLETGLGLATGQGSDPQLMLRWSDDGGQTWSAERWVSAGMIGAYKARAIWRRLGQGRDRVYELTVTDPIPWRVVNAWIDVRGGMS